MTPLGIDESLAFRAFDKSVIFGHWLSKHSNWHWPPGHFFWKRSLLHPSRLFSKVQKIFFQKSFFEREALRYFHMGLYRFPHMLYRFPSDANIGQQNLVSATVLSAFIYICFAMKMSLPIIKDCMTYTPFLSRTQALHYYRSHISLAISSPHLQMLRWKHRQCYL